VCSLRDVAERLGARAFMRAAALEDEDSVGRGRLTTSFVSSTDSDADSGSYVNSGSEP
jgi:hypothetical protein